MAKRKSEDMALEETELEAEVERLKRERATIGDSRLADWFPKNPAFQRVWVTDVKNQVQDFLNKGYTFMTQDEWDRECERVDGPRDDKDPRERGPSERRVSRRVGRAHVQDNAVAYLMQVPVLRYRALQVLRDQERSAPIKQIHGDAKALKGAPGFFGQGLQSKRTRG